MEKLTIVNIKFYIVFLMNDRLTLSICFELFALIRIRKTDGCNDVMLVFAACYVYT